MRYAWARQNLFKLDANVVGEHIESLVEKYNEHLTADEILADARATRSPIHDAFEWDDSVAAEKFRRRQARALVISLVPMKGTKKMRTRAFVFVRHAKHERKVYMPVRSAMGRPDMRDQLIENAYRQLDQWMTHYAGRPELRFVAGRVASLKKRIHAELMAMV